MAEVVCRSVQLGHPISIISRRRPYASLGAQKTEDFSRMVGAFSSQFNELGLPIHRQIGNAVPNSDCYVQFLVEQSYYVRCSCVLHVSHHRRQRLRQHRAVLRVLQGFIFRNEDEPLVQIINYRRCRRLSPSLASVLAASKLEIEVLQPVRGKSSILASATWITDRE